MATASGSIAYLGAARFQGFWDASTNNATGSGLPGGKWNNIADAGMKGLFSTGSQNPSGYAGDHLVSASAGDYWQVTGSTAAQANTGVAGTHNVGGIVSWQLNDWCVYSASAGSTGEWVRLGYQDTIASVIVGDLSAPDVFHLTGGANTHVVFVTGTVDSSVVFSGSKNFTFDYDNNSLGVTGTFVLDGNATLGDGDSDVTTVNSRLTASAGLYVYEKASFHNDLVGRADVSLGTNGTHVTTVNGQLTASEGILAEKKSTFSSSVLIVDDTRLYFGKDQDAYIEFDETSLIISGASPAGGTKISGNLVVGADASDDFLVSSRLTASEGIRSLKKSYFATDIEVDGLAKFDGYVILGNAASDVTVATSQFTASEGILASKKSTFSASVLVTDDTKVYFGNDHDAYIEFDDTHLIISGASPAGTRVSGNIVLGNDASDIVTVSARLTASEGILASKKSYFNDSVVLGDAAADVVSVSGQLTASEGISATKKSTFSATTLISDDTKLYFGDDHDSYIEFDETNLVISGSGGSGGGVTVSGTLLVSDDTQIDGFLDVDTIRRRGDSDNNIFIGANQFDQLLHGDRTFNIALASNGTGSVQINQAMKDMDFLIYANSHVDGPLYSVWVSGSDGVVHSNYGMHVHDDKKIVFGDDNDSHIEYDTGGINDYLVISGSSAGLVLSGTSVIIDGTLEGASPLSVGDVLLADDKKIYFGADSDAYIEYDSSFLIISGASPLGTKVSGNIILGGASDQTTISGPLVLSSDVAAGTSASPIDVALNGNLSCSANLTVGGNLLVNGTTVTQDVVNSVIQDPIIGLGYGVTGSTDASTGSAGDRGLVMGITGSNAVAMIWDNSATQFAFVTTANNPDDVEITPATYEDLRVSAIDIGGAAILSDHGVAKVQHTVTGALGGLKHDAGKLFIDLKNLPSGTTNIVPSDLMAFQDGHGSGSTRVLPVSKLINLVTASAAVVTALNNKAESRLLTIGSTTTELDGEANLTYDGTTFTINDDAKINDDFPFYFGSDSDALIKYRETGDNLLVISGSKGSAGGLVLSGSKLFFDGGMVSSGTVAGAGSYLGVTATGQVVLDETPGGSGAGGDITSVVAGDGLSGGAASGDATVYLNLNELSGSRTHPLAADHIAVLDSGDKGTKKLTITNLVSAITASNGGLDATSGKLSISGSALADGTVSFSNDQIIFIDSDGSPKRETIADLFAAISGTTAEFNNVTATVTSTAAVFSGSGISTIHKVNADHLAAVGNSTAAIFSGSGVSTIHKVNADHLAAVGNSTAAVFSGSGTSTIHKVTSDHLNVGGNVVLSGLASGSLAGQGSYLGITTTGQIVLAAPTSSAGDGDITAVIAGDGLSGGATSGNATLYLNLNDLSGSRTHPLAGDHIAVLDSGDKGTKKLTITNLVSSMTASNGGLDATSGKLSISGSALADGTVSFDNDQIIFIDSDGSPKRETITDLFSAISGTTAEFNNVTATVTSTAAVFSGSGTSTIHKVTSDHLNVGGNVVLTGLASGSLAGQGSYLGITTSGQIVLAAPTSSAGDGDITAVIAGDGLSGGATSGNATLYLNLNDLSGSRAHPLAGDHIAVLDSGDKGTKKLTITNLVSSITASNGGLDATSGKLSISGSALADATVSFDNDQFIFIDSDGSPKRETITDLFSAISGTSAEFNNVAATVTSTAAVFSGSGISTIHKVNADHLAAVGNSTAAIFSGSGTSTIHKITSDHLNVGGNLALTGLSSGSLAGQGSYLGITTTGQVVLAAPTSSAGGGGDITAVVAGDGLSGGATSGNATLYLNLNDLSGSRAHPLAGDHIAVLDSGDKGTKKLTITNLVSSMTASNGGLDATSGKLSISGSALADGTVSFDNDQFIFIDSDGSAKRETITDLFSAISGTSAEFNNVTATVTSTAAVFSGSGISTIHKVNADHLTAVGNSTAAIFSGSGISTIHKVNADHLAAVGNSTAAIFSGSGTSTIHRITSDHLNVGGNLALTGLSSGSLAGQGSYLGITTTGQVVLAAPTSSAGGSGDITAVAAGDGLSGGAASGDATLYLNLNELSGSRTHPLAADHLAVVDSGDKGTKKLTITNLVSAITASNGGLDATSGKLSISGSALADGTVAVGSDEFIFIDSDGSPKRETIADLATAMAGVGLTAGSGQLALHFAEISAVTLASTDSVMILDNNSATKRSTVTQLGDYLCGSNGGLAHTAGVLTVSGSNLADGTVDFDNDQFMFIDSDGSPKRETITDLFSAISGTTAEFNNITATVTSNAAVFSGSGISTLHKVASQTSYASVFSGSGTSTIHKINADHIAIVGSLDLGEKNIANVGDISLDSISSDASLVTINAPSEIANSSTGGATALIIDNDDTDEIALAIQAANIDANVVNIDADAVTTANVIDISADELSSGKALNIVSNSSNTTARNIALIHQDHASATAATTLRVVQDSTAPGLHVQGPVVTGVASTPSNNSSGQTVTVANMLKGTHTAMNRGASQTDTFDTAANIVGAIPNAVVGDAFELLILNIGMNTVTFAGGTGITNLAGSAASFDIAANNGRMFKFVLQNVGGGSEAVTMCPLSDSFATTS